MRRVFGAKPASDAAVATPVTPASTSPVSTVETFKNDYNILGLHQRVLAHFQQETATLPSKKAQLDQLQWIYQNGTTVAERKLAHLEIDNLKEWVERVTSRKEEQEYLKLSAPLLQEYQQLTVSKKNRVFGEKKVVDEAGEAREFVILRYLALVRRYLDVNVSLDTSCDPVCPICDSLLAEGAGSCKNCPAFIIKFETDNSCKDPEQPKTTARSNYAKHGHIYEAFIKFQGKQANNLPAGLLEDLNETREAFGLSKEVFTIDMLFQIMRDKQYSPYYDDVYLIYHLITGKKLPDLEDIMPELEKDANEFSEIYPEIKPKARLNCLNAHFIRDSFLLRRGRIYPGWQCTFLRTETVSIVHNEVMALAYQRLGWGPYKPL